MYIPSAFLEDDLSTLHELMDSSGLANIITSTSEGITATPMPLWLAPAEGAFGTLYGHLARANPQWTQKPTADALALFTGPDAYISPSWYPSKQAHHKVVPTWNYIAVHAYGPIEFFEDEARLLHIVRNLTTRQERLQPQPWKVEDAPSDYIRSMLKAIIGVRLPITRLEGKWKMSQNRSAQDRQGVAAGLSRSPHESVRDVGVLIPLQD